LNATENSDKTEIKSTIAQDTELRNGFLASTVYSNAATKEDHPKCQLVETPVQKSLLVVACKSLTGCGMALPRINTGHTDRTFFVCDGLEDHMAKLARNVH
jgi:hypothetical protein